MEIIYCGGCGTRLKPEDLLHGKARMLDNRPWCVDCKPPDKVPIPAASPSRRQGSSAKHPRITPETARKPDDPAEARRKQFQLLLVVGGVVVLVIILAMVVLMKRS